MDNWIHEDNSLVKNFNFGDFKQAFSFMTEVALYAETMDHHPAWHNVYNKVKITLNTHEAGNIVTEKDRRLAEIIDKVYLKFQG